MSLIFTPAPGTFSITTCLATPTYFSRSLSNALASVDGRPVLPRRVSADASSGISPTRTQYAQGFGGITGGLTDFTPPEDAYFFLDHDQRNTLSTGFNLSLPWRMLSDFNLNYGSGFLDGDGPNHLPSHTTFDLALGKSFGENWSVRLTGLNLSDHRYLLDNSNTFGGTHYANPRELSVQLKYRFRY